MKEMKKKANNAYAYISIVAIVAIVAVFVMFAGSGSKETSQPIVLDSGIGGDLVGDAIGIRDSYLSKQDSDIRGFGGTISGKVYRTENEMIPNVKIMKNGEHVATTDNNGNYQFSFSGYFTGEIYAEKEGWAFAPRGYDFNYASGTHTEKNFIGCQVGGGTCTGGNLVIEGTVKHDDLPLPNIRMVRITEGEANDITYTNSEGRYSFSVPYGWSGLIRPSNHPCIASYSPSERIYPSVWNSLYHEDYDAFREQVNGLTITEWSEEDAQTSATYFNDPDKDHPQISWEFDRISCFENELVRRSEESTVGRNHKDRSGAGYNENTISPRYVGDFLIISPNAGYGPGEPYDGCWRVIPAQKTIQVPNEDYQVNFIAIWDCEGGNDEFFIDSKYPRNRWEYYTETISSDPNTCHHWGSGMECSNIYPTPIAGNSCVPFDECILSSTWNSWDNTCTIEGLICEH